MLVERLSAASQWKHSNSSKRVKKTILEVLVFIIADVPLGGGRKMAVKGGGVIVSVST